MLQLSQKRMMAKAWQKRDTSQGSKSYPTIRYSIIQLSWNMNVRHFPSVQTYITTADREDGGKNVLISVSKNTKNNTNSTT